LHKKVCKRKKKKKKTHHRYGQPLAEKQKILVPVYTTSKLHAKKKKKKTGLCIQRKFACET
tara:strand:+ start:23003 stop:23185 length:183 start_codon:yes stop_codon:yes gene_type:complete